MTTITDIVVKAKLCQSGQVLAIAEVILGGVVETKGWRVMHSSKMHERFQEKLWIVPPSVRVGQGYKTTVYISDKQLYADIEEAIYSKYCQLVQNNMGDVVHKPSEEVDVNDIPF